MLTPSPTEVQYMKQHIQDDKHQQVIISSAVCLVAVYLAVSLRFYARYIARVKYGMDDWFILMALVSQGLQA